MIRRLDCQRARRSFADLLVGRPDPAASSHLGSCPACASELAALRSTLDQAMDCGAAEVPDPGADYWDTFLPRVRARLEARPSRSRSPLRRMPAAASFRRAAAASILVALAGVAGWIAHRPTGSDGAPAPISDEGLDEALARAGDATVLDLLAGEDPGSLLPDESIRLAASAEADVTTEEIIDAIDAIDCPMGSAALCREDELQRLLERLDDEGASLMRDELSADLG